MLAGGPQGPPFFIALLKDFRAEIAPSPSNKIWLPISMKSAMKVRLDLDIASRGSAHPLQRETFLMPNEPFNPGFNRRTLLAALAAFAAASGTLTPAPAEAQVAVPGNPLPSWNDGPAKKAILDFIHATTDPASKDFVPPEERIATFDQDGTLWVEHPIYSQLVYCLDRVPALVKAKPHLAKVEPFKTVLTGDFEKIGKLPLRAFEEIAVATLTGMDVETFQAEVKAWIGEAKDHRWKRLYTELTYQPMQEVLTLFRANGYKTFIVTGGGQDFVRVYSRTRLRNPA